MRDDMSLIFYSEKIMTNNDYWQIPPIYKIYEAITCIADKRIETNENKTEAKIYSSSGNKFYTVEYNPEKGEIMANDNSAWFTDKISYTMIALLMLRGDLKYDKDLEKPLANIFWKKINQKYKNDYAKAAEEVLKSLKDDYDINWIKTEVEKIYEQVKILKLKKLGKKKFPPKGF